MTFIDFRIAGQNIGLEKIGQILGVDPTHTCKTGDVYQDKFKIEPPIAFKEDVWTYKVEILKDDETSARLSEFVDLFYKNKEYVKTLARMHDTTLWVTMYPDTYQTHLNIPHGVLSRISALEVGFGFTCMQI